MTSTPVITQEDLGKKLAQQRLSPVEVVTGIRECFILTHRAFIQRRQPELPTEEIDSFSAELVDEVYENENLNPAHLSLALLRHVVRTLDDRFEFAEDPELASIHEGVLAKLINKLVL